MKKLTLLIMTCVSLLLLSCTPKDPQSPSGIINAKGVFVLNEGTYTYANSSLTFYNPVTDSAMNNLFYRANGAPIGDVGQSLALIDGKLYIVVNNSNYIYKVDGSTLVCDTTQPYLLDGFYSPRYMLPLAPNKAYVSDLVGREIWIINPENMTHTGSVSVGKPTETMVLVGNEVYATNWSNYYDTAVVNNTVMVVDAQQDIKVAEIVVGKEPNGMVVDPNGQIWVLCEGAYWAEDMEYPTLWRINPQTKVATCVQTFENTAMCLAIDPLGTCLYCLVGGDVRRIALNHPEVMDDGFSIPSEGRTLYKIAVSPYSGELYVTDAKNYMISGTVYRYSADGLLLSSFNAGIIPSFMLFN